MGAQPPPVHEPLGALAKLLRHPATEVVEKLGRILPEQSWFTTSPSQVELVSFTVPQGQMFWLMDYQMTPYTFSGIAAGEAVPSYIFQLSLASDILIDGSKRPYDVTFDLEPAPAVAERRSFVQFSGRRRQVQFNAAAVSLRSNLSGAGSSLLPVRRKRVGPEQGPFTWFVDEGQTISMQAVIRRPLSVPVAFLEGVLSGYMIHTQVAEAFLSRIKVR